jgi:hypothetical protein
MDIKLRGILYRKSDILSRHVKNKITRNKYNLLFQQFGGAGNKLTVTYNDIKYIFEETMDDDYYILFSKDEKEECVMIVISKKEKTAEIHGIGNYKSCIMDTNENVGSTLLKITIKMLKKYKDRFGIEMIILTDNSLKRCKDENIQLGNMLTLLTGDTWYGKYGFRPIKYSKNKYVVNEYFSKLYEKNKHIIDSLKICDLDLIKYINLTENSPLIKATSKIIFQYPEMLLKDYLTNIMKQYDDMCEHFNKFYMELYDDIGLYNFHKQLLGLVI